MSTADHLAGSTVEQMFHDPQIERLLTFARTHLGMDVAWLSSFTEGHQVIEAANGHLEAMNVQAGDRTELSGSFCTRVVAGVLPAAITDARRNLITRELAITGQLGIGSYIGAPWRDAGGGVAGMLCCISRRPNTELDESAVQFVQLLADLITDHLASPHARQAEHRRRQSAAVHHILDNEALRIVVQPVVRIADGVTVAYEALTRFDPDLFATPDRGFAAAADCDLGVSLELLAAEHALGHLRHLPEQVWLGINMSAAALRTREAHQLLLAHAHQRIGVEITEHTPVGDYAQLNADLAPLRAAGIQIAVDDAGAGYAGLNHILQLHPDVIKLDMSLVRGIDQDPVRQALTRSLIDFSRHIKAVLLAEGVETPAERSMLHHLGIDYGQGYLWGHPQSPGTPTADQ